HVVALDDGGGGGGRVGDGVAQAPGQRLDEALDGLGLLGGKLGRDHQHVAVKLHAVVAHQDQHDVVDGQAARLQVHVDREREAEYGIDLAGGEHGLAHGEADVLEFHGRVVELV